MADAPLLPGRLGRPELELQDDPRADPRLVATLAPLGLATYPAEAPIDHTSPIEAILEYLAVAEEGFEALFALTASALPRVEGVERSVEVIRGVDGNDITLYVHRPVGGGGPRPAVLHLHGGGMVFLSANGPGYHQWRDELAGEGLFVVGVEFRNAGGKLGNHPFPAGLNDCSSALQWLHDNRDRLGVSKIVVSGESGGGNLTLATTLKAKRDGKLRQIDGVYAQCPYISGRYVDRPAELTSLFENDGYFLSGHMMGGLVPAYDPDGANAENPLAWPYFASVDDLAGLPPHVISVNQLDPLRDEGLAYFRKLLGAGVSAVSRTVNGTTHAADCIYRNELPDVYLATIRDIAGFARSL